MPPYIEEVGHDPGDSASGASAGGDVAAPVTDSPSPSPTPPSTPSPVMAQWHEDPTPPLLSDYLPTDHDLPRILREVSGTDDLVSVRSLRLRVISSDISLQRLSLYIPHLTSLDLDGSSINSLRDLGCSLMSLRVLKVGQCGLETLDGMFGLSSLRELHAPGNRVDDVGPCTSLPSIRLIDLARNNIEDISYVEFLAICQDLEELCLQGTPAAAQPNYRLTVYQLLPQLRTLDGIPLPSNLIGDVVGAIEEPEPEQDEDSDDCDGAAGGGARPIGSWGPRSPCPGGSGASSRFGAGSPYPGPSTADTTECKTRALNLLNHGPLLTRRRKEELPERPFTAPGGPMRPQLKPLKLTGTTQKSLQRSKRPKTALPSCGYETGSKDRLPPCRNSTPGWFRSSDSISGGLTSSHSPVSLRVCPNRQNITLSKTKCIGDRKPVVIESDYPLDPAQDILEASKRWRLMYRSFRAQHSNRWQKESDVLDSKSKLHPRPTDSVNDAEKSANLDQSFNEVSLPKLPKIV